MTALRLPTRVRLRPRGGMLARTLYILAALAALALLLAIGLGGPHPPPPLASIVEPFRSVKFDKLPAPAQFLARDGTRLAYRLYAAEGSSPRQGSVMLVHGSSANGRSMHPLAARLAAAGFTVYVFDMRGHGSSGRKGRIDYIGQLEDDLEDFIAGVQPAHPRVLAGFSSGGGFTLRFAGSPRGTLLDGYLLLAPYIHYAAPTSRREAGSRWASVGIPRLVALDLLNRNHITVFNQLPVIAFAVPEDPQADLASWYSYALFANFQPGDDYPHAIRALARPAALVVGAQDELFHADQFRPLLDGLGRQDIPVSVIPGCDHIGLILSGAARDAVVNELHRLEARIRR